MSVDAIKNYVGGGWTAPASRDDLPVVNPATAEVIAKVPLSSKSDIDRAASAAAEALPGWRRTPPGDRIQPLFKLKQLLEENIEDIARTIDSERECCPFLQFTLTVEPASGPIHLDLTGPSGTREFLTGLFEA